MDSLPVNERNIEIHDMKHIVQGSPVLVDLDEDGSIKVGHHDELEDKFNPGKGFNILNMLSSQELTHKKNDQPDQKAIKYLFPFYLQCH